MALSMLMRGAPRLVRHVAVSTKAIARALSTVQIPANLKLANEEVFKEPPKKIIPEMEFYFPPLNPPKSIRVLKFKSSGEYLDVDAVLNPTVFGVAIRQDIVHEAVRYQRHLTRQPYKSKRSFEIRGSTKKPYAQKGGGKAQAGNKRASHWKGGQKAHGPHLRSFAIGMNKKQRALALMITLAAKQREGNLIVFDSFTCESHRTKDLVEILANHGLHETKIAVVDENLQQEFECACRNLPLVTPLEQQAANVYDIVRQDKLAITVDALASLQERLVGQYKHIGKRKALLEGLDELRNHRGFAVLAAKSA